MKREHDINQANWIGVSYVMKSYADIGECYPPR